MSRLAKLLLIAALMVSAGIIFAQETPLPTPEVGAPTQQFPTLPPVASPTPGVELLPTEEVAGDTAPLPTSAVPDATLSPALGVEQSEALPILIAARNDLELLATAAIGSELRPVGWSGSIDVTDSQLPLLIRLDLEILAGAVVGAENRPEGWFGVVPSIPLAVARDIRHDLELLADIVIGTSGIRPAGWQSDDPIMRCSRATQALFTMLEFDRIAIEVDFTQPDACAAAEQAAAVYVERNILQPPVLANAAGVPLNQGRYRYTADNPFVVAFLDRKATRKIGILPVGTGFEPVARSYFEFSNMMLVRGDNFQVFVDYTTTQITNDQFLSLPDIGGGFNTDCQAAWCGVGLD